MIRRYLKTLWHDTISYQVVRLVRYFHKRETSLEKDVRLARDSADLAKRRKRKAGK